MILKGKVSALEMFNITIIVDTCLIKAVCHESINNKLEHIIKPKLSLLS